MTNAIYKLHAGNDPLGMMGALLREPALAIDRGRMSAKGWITRQHPDRVEDVMVAAGGIVDDHRKLPTVQLNHNKLVPCGRAEDPLGAYTVKRLGDGWEGETYFSQSTEVGEQTFRLVESKVLCGMSVGFMPVHGMMAKSAGGGTVYKQWRLVEYSHVVIPEHPDCLVEVVYKGLGGKPLCQPIMDILRPLTPERPEMVAGGWDAESVRNQDSRFANPIRSKAMGGLKKPQDVDPNAQPDLSAGADEFMPPDPIADPNALDPNAQQDPHADHKAVVSQASEDTTASVWDKFTSQQLDRKTALKLIDKIMRHFEDIHNLGQGGDDEDEEGFDEDADEEGDEDSDDEFGENFDDDEGGDDADDSSSMPDLEDKAKKKAEKAVGVIWMKSYAPVMTSVAEGLAHIVRADDPDARKIQKYAKQLLTKMGKSPEFDPLVKKAMAELDDPWSEWNSVFIAKSTSNGTH